MQEKTRISPTADPLADIDPSQRPSFDEKKIRLIYKTGLQGPKGDTTYIGQIDGGGAASQYGGTFTVDGGNAEGN